MNPSEYQEYLDLVDERQEEDEEAQALREERRRAKKRRRHVCRILSRRQYAAIQAKQANVAA